MDQMQIRVSPKNMWLCYCYGEVYDKKLAAEAHSIINSWGDRQLTKEEQEIQDTLANLEKYPYSYSDISQ